MCIRDRYKEYEPLYDCAKQVADKQGKKGFFVTCDTYVTMSDGPGIVHIAPAFGEDDANVGRNYDLPFVPVSYTHLETRKSAHTMTRHSGSRQEYLNGLTIRKSRHWRCV